MTLQRALAKALAVIDILDRPPQRSFGGKHTPEQAAEHAGEFTGEAQRILAALAADPSTTEAVAAALCEMDGPEMSPDFPRAAQTCDEHRDEARALVAALFGKEDVT